MLYKRVIRFLQDAEIAKLTALLKKTEMKATSLERTVRLLHVLTMISLIAIINIDICNFFQVEQKNRENQELTTICDDLIAKVKISENLH